MTDQRTHYATTTDGVTIGGSVYGQGPALVFLQGAVGDGALDWRSVAEHLSDRYTCHLPSQRGRGLSGDHPDLGGGRIIEDFTAYVDSIGEPAGLVGWSGGAYFALGVAEMLPDAVTAVAAFEPGILTLMDEAEQGVVGATITRAAELAAAGDLAAAARAFLRWPFTDQDIAGADEAGYVEAAARYVPNLLSMLQQAMAEGHSATEVSAIEDPAALATIAAPVLVLQGSETKPFFVTSARYAVDHIPHARMQEIPGAGHAAPLTHPQALASALNAFLSSVSTTSA